MRRLVVIVFALALLVPPLPVNAASHVCGCIAPETYLCIIKDDEGNVTGTIFVLEYAGC